MPQAAGSTAKPENDDHTDNNVNDDANVDDPFVVLDVDVVVVSERFQTTRHFETFVLLQQLSKSQIKVNHIEDEGLGQWHNLNSRSSCSIFCQEIKLKRGLFKLV